MMNSRFYKITFDDVREVIEQELACGWSPIQLAKKYSKVLEIKQAEALNLIYYDIVLKNKEKEF